MTGGRSGTTARAAAAAAVAVIALALLLPRLGSAPFDDPGEGQHAEIAREMWQTGDVVTLRLNGVRYFDKPPLLYWLVAGSFASLGPSEYAARLAPVAGAVAAVLGTAVLGARLLGPPWGLAAGAALLSSPLFFAFGRYVRPETLFVAGIQWAFTGWLIGLMEPADSARRRRWLLVGCAGLALASIAKDPLGLVGPLAAVSGALLFVGGRPKLVRVPWAGLLLILVVGVGWYLVVGYVNPGFGWYAIVDNHLLNLVQRRHFPDEDVPLSSLEFAAVTVLGAFPWTLAAGLEMARLIRRRAWRDRAETPWVALAFWAAGLVAFFSIAPFKLPHYGLPAYPAIALLAARYWSRRRRAGAFVAVHLAGFAALAAALACVYASDGRLFTEVVFSSTDVYTRKEAAAGQASSLPLWSAFAPLVGGGALIFAAGTVGLAAALARAAPRAALAVIAGTMLALMPIVAASTAMVASGRAVAPMAERIRAAMGRGDLLVHEGPIENSGALEFYSGHRPVLLDGRRSVLGMGGTFADARGVFWDVGDLEGAWASGRSVFLVTPRAPAHSLVNVLPPGSVHLLWSGDGRWLYGNRPAPTAAAGLAAPAPSRVTDASVAAPSSPGLR